MFQGDFIDNQKMTTNEVVNLLLTKERDIDARIITAVSELLRLGYDSERGRQYICDTLDSIRYIVDDIERRLNR